MSASDRRKTTYNPRSIFRTKQWWNLRNHCRGQDLTIYPDMWSKQASVPHKEGILKWMQRQICCPKSIRAKSRGLPFPKHRASLALGQHIFRTTLALTKVPTSAMEWTFWESTTSNCSTERNRLLGTATFHDEVFQISYATLRFLPAKENSTQRWASHLTSTCLQSSNDGSPPSHWLRYGLELRRRTPSRQ